MKQYAIFSGGKYLGTFESVNPAYALAMFDSKRLKMSCLATFEVGKTTLSYDDGKEYVIYYN